VESLCPGAWDDPVLQAGSTVHLPPDQGCLNKRFLYKVHIPDLEGLWHPLVHRPCLHNEAAAVLHRVLAPVPDPTPHGLVIFQAAMGRLRSALRRGGVVRRWSLDEVVSCYSGSKRKRYEAARETLTHRLSTARDAEIRAFVKCEKFGSNKVTRPPRLIQGRAPEFNLELFQWYKPFEQRLYSLGVPLSLSGVPTKTRFIAKGMNEKQRAALVLHKMESIPDCAVIGLDASAFDAHVNVPMLRSEHKTIMAVCGQDERLRWLLSQQLETYGRTPQGVRYTRVGGRCSGDDNTGGGNSLLMGAMSIAACGELGIRPFDLMVDGDNTLIFLPNAMVASALAGLPAIFEEMGHEVKVESVATRAEQVEFGQCRPVHSSVGWKMVRNPLRTLARACSSAVHFHEPRGGLRVLKTVAMGELALNRGVPVLQPYFAAILEELRDVEHMDPMKLGISGHLYSLGAFDTRAWLERRTAPITVEARLSFEAAWGIDPEEQLLAEQIVSAGVKGRIRLDSIPEIVMADVMESSLGCGIPAARPGHAAYSVPQTAWERRYEVSS